MIPDEFPAVTTEKRAEFRDEDPSAVIVLWHNRLQTSTVRIPTNQLKKLANELLYLAEELS